MDYRSFNFKKLKEQFGIQPRLSPLFPSVQPIAPSAWLFKDGTVLSAIYGAVTTGDVWRFLKLSGDAIDRDLQIDSETHYLDNLPIVLGILQRIVETV